MPNLMYHHVGSDDRLKGISLEDFRSQLDFLQKNYSPKEFVLTFDHGTIDHFEIAAPELDKRRLKGVFFIMTIVQDEYRVPSIDKQRRLETLFRLDFCKTMCDALGIDYRPEDGKEYLKEFTFYSIEERYLRFLRDNIIRKEVYETFVGEYFLKVFGDEVTFASREYLSWDHVIDLHRRGHIIGSHSHTHYGDSNDYAASKKSIEEKLNSKLRDVSYPNGVKRISDKELESLGVERAYLSVNRSAGQYQLGRIDCNLLSNDRK